MHRRIGALTALALVATLAGPVAAAAPERSTSTNTWFECSEPLVGVTGVAILGFLEIHSEGDVHDAFVDLAVWAGLTEPAGEPSAFAVAASGSQDDTSISVTVDLEDINGDPAGSAEISATIAPDGDAVPFSFRDRVNNQWRVSEGTDQAIVVEAGTLSIGEDVIALVGCAGMRRIETVFFTSPNATVVNQTFRDVFCQLAVGDRTIFVDGFGTDDGLSLFVSVAPDGLFGGTDLPWASDGSGGWLAEGTFEVFDADGGPAGSASVELHLTPDGDPVLQYLPRRVGFEKSLFQPYTVSGSIAFPDVGLETSDLSSCEALGEEILAVRTSQKGPKAPTPSNDTPEGAIALTRGADLWQRTGGASDGEAGTSCLEGPFGSVPFAKTVWYTITGDGAPMTLDTAGSDFDTVVAVYVDEDPGEDLVLTEIACADDIFLDLGRTLQASISGDTEAGVTYWIQVGGWQDEWGRLHVTLD
jgi:hypothetical protein